MKMNITNMMFLTIMMNSIIMVTSSNNVLFSWMSMELNLISFMPILSQSKKMSDHLMKYLIIQSISSSLMLMSITINSLMNLNHSNSFLLMMSMIMKMGMMPTHLWLPPVMMNLSWKNCLIMSTIQKLIPMIITSQMINIKMMMPTMIISLLMSPMLGMKQLSTKKMMAYSSISNMPWMLMAIYTSMQQFLMFMMIYTLMTFMIMNLMNKNNLNFLNQTKPLSKWSKLNLMLMLLSLSGMPPTMGFAMKWIILNSAMNNQMMMLSVSMILSSTMISYMYMKMAYSSMLMMTSSKKKFSINLSAMFIVMNLTMILMIMILPTY